MKVDMNKLMEHNNLSDKHTRLKSKNSSYKNLIKGISCFAACLAFVGGVTIYQSMQHNESASADALYDESEAYPTFTVQHVGNVTVPDVQSGDGQIPVLTDDEFLHADFNTDGTIKFKSYLAPLYDEYITSWKDTDGIAAMSFLNGIDGSSAKGYILKQIWFGTDKGSEDQSDFTVLDVPYADGQADISHITLTNNPKHPELSDITDGHYTADADGNYTVCIHNGDVVKLVFEAENGWDAGGINVYDYDVSDGGYYLSDDYSHKNNKRPTSRQSDERSTIYVDAIENGIHSTGNYQGNGAKLAFGGADIGTDLAEEYITDDLDTLNVLNYAKQEQTHGMGVTTGLTTGINADGSIRWASGISVPNLFHGSAYGKTDYTDGKYSIAYRRAGFSKTLYSVESQWGTSAEGLDVFSNINGDVTNSFWIADNAPSYGSDDHDPIWGDGSEKIQYYRSKDRAPEPFLPSVDGQNHNRFFGFSSTEDFILSPGYTGPLEFFGYSDDDLWIFAAQVDENGQVMPDTAVKVIDLGGVHEQTAYYCNLWNLIDKIPYGENAKHYRLFMFWLERDGKSASCYLNFTTPEPVILDSHETGSVIVEAKKADSSDDFRTFILDNGSYNKYQGTCSNGTNIVITSGKEFSLQNGLFVDIVGLDKESSFTISETNASRVWSSSGNEYKEETAKTGIIGTDNWFTFVSAKNKGSLGIMVTSVGDSNDAYPLRLKLNNAPNVEISAMDRQNNPLGSRFTDENGELVITLGSDEMITLYNLPDDADFVLEPDTTAGWHVTEIILDNAAADGAMVSGKLPAYVAYRYEKNETIKPQISIEQSIGNDWNSSDILLGTGALLSYKIKVENLNDVPINVTVEDILPDGLEIMESLLMDGGIIDGQKVIWNAIVDAGSVKELSFTCQVNAKTGEINNNAQVIMNDEIIGSSNTVKAVIPQ